MQQLQGINMLLSGRLKPDSSPVVLLGHNLVVYCACESNARLSDLFMPFFGPSGPIHVMWVD